MSYLYWAVKCKTPDCNAVTHLEFIGLYEKAKMPFIVDAEPIKVPCQQCGKTYEYDKDEVFPNVSDLMPPKDMLDAFLKQLTSKGDA